ncbi:hypothetical protein Tco_1053743 [Tanacetum coccineum]|uniref:Tf2-1-like SH3-like domain-containing protein n=1 Tax=Tanacetum coccineum TaxID=301880 RepID=A0ABQ5GUS5_9ASTR
MLKVSPRKGVIRFGKRGKLNPRYIGPFKILERIGPVAYKLELPEEISNIHSTFYVSNLKKCLSNESLVIPMKELRLDDKLNFVEEPVEIMDREVKQLKQSRIPIVKNKVLVVKPHNKTPYELFRGRTPALSFMRPFGCHVTILNTLDYLGKFYGKSDEGFFVGYSMNVGYLGSDRPKWQFDIDVLTKSMNYVPVVAGTNSNDSVGTEESIGTGHSSKETRSSQDYILMPLWKDGLLFDSSLKNASNDEPQPSSDAKKKDYEGVCKESGIADQEKSKNSTQGVNTVGPKVDMSNITTIYPVPSTPNTRIHKDHSLDHVIGDVQSGVLTRRMIKTTNEQGFIRRAQKGNPSIKRSKLDRSYARRASTIQVIIGLDLGGFTTWQKTIGTKWVYRNKKDEKGIVIRNKARQGCTGKYTMASRPDIMFAVCAYARFQVTLAVSHPSCYKHSTTGRLSISLEAEFDYHVSATAKEKTVQWGSAYIKALVERKEGDRPLETSVRRALQIKDAEVSNVSKPQKKQSRKKHRKDTEVPQPSGSTNPITNEAANEEHVPIHSNDPLLNGGDILKLNELMKLCTNLSQRVLDLGNTKTSQAAEITKLKERVKKARREEKIQEHQGLKRIKEVFDDPGKLKLKRIKAVKPKDVTTAATITTNVVTRPKARGVVLMSNSNDKAEEQESLTIEERSKLFVELIDKRKKHFAKLRAEEIRRKPTNQKPKMKKSNVPEEAYERVLWGDLKVMFEPVESKESAYLYAGREKVCHSTPATSQKAQQEAFKTDHLNRMCYQRLKPLTKTMQEPGRCLKHPPSKR